MIAKINSGTSIFGAIEYNQKKINEGHAKIILQNNMIENYSGDRNMDLHFALRSFEPYLIANRRTEKTVIHISLNPHPEDRLSDEQYAQLAHDYMEKMGFGNQPYIVYKHEDIDRHHLHIISVRVDENGKKIPDSFEKLRSMDACRELETKFKLHPALKKEREFGENFIKKLDYERGDVKRQISNTVRSLLQMYRFQTLGEYNALLSCYNIDVKHVKGEKFGKEYNGIVYSAKNDKGEMVSNPFKSSLFGKMFGFDGLTKIMKNNTEILKTKDMAGRSKSVVSAAMKTARTKKQFIKALQAKGMDVVFRTNDEGRIYGVTFIDHENMVVLNGSRLGKEFSANVFNALFNENKAPDERKKPKQNNSESEQEPKISQKSETDTGKSIISSVADGVFDVIEILQPFDLLQPHGENYDDAEYKRKKRKKKRKTHIN
jgi:hypothetical protein